MSKIVALPATGHANCNADVAKFLREIAENIEAGALGTIRQVVLTIESNERIEPGSSLETWVAGGPCDNARIVGLMQMAQIKFIDGY